MTRWFFIGFVVLLMGFVLVFSAQAQAGSSPDIAFSASPLDLTPPCLPPICNPPPSPSPTTPTVTTTPVPSGTPPPTPAPPPLISALEVNQGIQNIANDMPLIENRLTMVRVHLSGDPGSFSFYSATLEGKRAGSSLPGSPLTADNEYRFRLALFPDRGKINQSLNFTLPPEWKTGAVDLEAVIEFTDRETNDPVTVRRSLSVTFQPAKALNLVMVPLEMHKLVKDPVSGDENPTGPLQIFDNRRTASLIIEGAKRYLPVNQMVYLAHPLYSPPEPLWGTPQPWQINTIDGKVRLHEDLAKLKAAEQADYGDIQTVYVGMIHPDVTFSQAVGPYTVGSNIDDRLFVTMDDQRKIGEPTWRMEGSETLAHELGHSLGLGHVQCAGWEAEPWEAYPWLNPCLLAPLDSEGYYGVEASFVNLGIPASIITNKSGEAYPLMGYQKYAWVSPYEFCKLMPALGIPCNLAFTSGPELSTAPVGTQRTHPVAPEGLYLLVIGRVNLADGSAEIRYLIDLASPPIDPNTLPETGFVLELRDGLDNLLATQPVHGQELDGTDHVVFAETLLKPAGLAKVQVVKDGLVVVEQVASANPPQISLTSPNQGSLVAGTNITWSGSDLDGDPLRYDLLYSRDGGQSWKALVLGTSQTQFLLASLDGLGGSNQVVLRVVASDGFHTTSDDSDGLLELADQAPEIGLFTFEDPSRPLTSAPGQSFWLSAFAFDPEDGALSGNSLTWTSDRDGFLDNGPDLFTNSLSPGYHSISLTASDSGRNQATATLQVFVGYETFLPVLFR